MDDEDVGRVWAAYYPKSGNNREALQICAVICRLIRANSKFVISFTRHGRLQRVLDGYGISKADFDEVEKSLFKISVSVAKEE